MTFALSLLSFYPRISIGFVIVNFFWQTTEKSYLLVKFFLSPLIGFGVSSLISFIWIWVGLSLLDYAYIEIVTSILFSLYFVFRHKKDIKITTPSINELKQKMCLFVLLTYGFIFSLLLLIQGLENPHGGFDAWYNWNVVSRFVYRDGQWQNTFLRTLAHADYPFFVPMSNALTWAYLHRESIFGPLAFHLTLSLFMVGLLFSFVNALNGIKQASLAVIFFIALPVATSAMSQYADFPLAYLILGIGGLTLLYFKTKQTKLIILIGFLTGLTAWTKNEGIILVVNNTILWCLIAFLNEKEILKRYISGLLFPFAVVILFKIFLAPENDVVSGAQNIFIQIFNLERIIYISKNFVLTFWEIGGSISLVGILLLYIFIVGRSSESISGIWAIVFMVSSQLFSYFIIYLITPHDLSWHIRTSLSRLIFHVLPLILLGVFCWLKSPEELWMKKEGEIHATSH